MLGLKAHWGYAKYLARHKWFVFVAGLRTKAPLWRLVIHDWSKFMPCEWFPYAALFYGPDGYKSAARKETLEANLRFVKTQAAFDRAWLHHQHFNPHHWQHWVLREDDGRTKYLEMPTHFTREMVADWCGAGRAITGKWEVWKWYEKNHERILLHENTKQLVNILISGEKEIQDA